MYNLYISKITDCIILKMYNEGVCNLFVFQVFN